MRSALVTVSPALYLVKLPEAVSKDTSAPAASFPVPRTLAKLTTGLAVNPKLALMPA